MQKDRITVSLGLNPEMAFLWPCMVSPLRIASGTAQRCSSIHHASFDTKSSKRAISYAIATGTP